MINDSPIDPLLISDRAAAALAGVSRATWRRLFVAGKTPQSTKLGRKRLWHRAEVVAWIDAGCPDARVWTAMRAQTRRLRAVV